MQMSGAFVLVTLAAAVGAGVRGVGAPASAGLLLVANKGDHTLGFIDPVAGRMVATVAESGVTGHEVVASPDGKTAYVPIYGNSGVGQPGSDGRTIDVFDVAARKRVSTIDFGSGQRPHDPRFGPDGRLYVTAEITSSIKVVDPRTNTVVVTIPTGQPESHMLVLSKDGTRAWTSNVGAGTVSAIDVPSKSVAAVIHVAARAQRIALSADERWVFTADQDAPRLAVIDTKTGKLAPGVALPGIAYGTASTPDGRWLLMALPGLSQVGVLDLKSMEVARVLDVPKTPQEVLVRPDGRVAYVSCDASGQVAEIDLVDWKVARLITAGRQADGLAWAPQP